MSRNVEQMPETIGGIDYRQHDAVTGSIALGERIRALMGKPDKPRVRVSVSIATGRCWREPKPPMSFDEQMQAVANGAKLIEVRPIRKADPVITLGGVSW